MNILYAEDDVMMQKVVIRSLIRLGYEVTTVEDGIEAIESVENEEYDLIILDVFMPRASGFEVVEHIREKLKLTTPVLMISRNHLDDAIHKAYTAGADEYIIKPFEPEELVVKITRMLTEKRNISE